MKLLIFLTSALGIAGVVCLAISNMYEFFWWTGLVFSVIGIIITSFLSIVSDNKLRKLEMNQDGVENSLNIIRDEEGNIISATIDSGEY